LLYTSRTDRGLAPAYDFFTTTVYEGYQNHPRGESVSWGGRHGCREKLWAPFVTSTFGISQGEQKEILERISDAVTDTAPAVRELMKGLAGFKDIGKRMLAAWSEGVSVPRDSRMYGLSPWKSAAAFEGISDPPKLKKQRTVIGRSELLSQRSKSK
jgi:serine/threonine-protein kinase HipA